MIKIEHVVGPSPDQMEFIIEGMRNPLNSWNKTDSEIHQTAVSEGRKDELYLGDNDRDLMKRLHDAGTDHRKFMRMMPIFVRVTAPLYWWKEFDTYKVGTVSNSCSTMHKIQAKEFTLYDFSTDHLFDICLLESAINELNIYRDIYNNYDAQTEEYKAEFSRKDVWWQMIQLLPSTYNQTRNVSMNYETMYNIWHARNNHKLDEWQKFCDLMSIELPYSWLFCEWKSRLVNTSSKGAK